MVQVIFFQKHSFTLPFNSKYNIVIWQKFYIYCFCSHHYLEDSVSKTKNVEFLLNHNVIFWVKQWSECWSIRTTCSEHFSSRKQELLLYSFFQLWSNIGNTSYIHKYKYNWLFFNDFFWFFLIFSDFFSFFLCFFVFFSIFSTFFFTLFLNFFTMFFTFLKFLNLLNVVIFFLIFHLFSLLFLLIYISSSIM